eukprot:CAMPEP_0173328130 /NCGR_PEP_ID=MMETSP1144-20121109/1990_1 /TAXON_ID=483371 /ORGANISM="non described non described, Strain CCMP2298" /LENGTH=32 /DNA_ID= /DNA_START= /DNA_END= /DNA_ORIENTATION=
MIAGGGGVMAEGGIEEIEGDDGRGMRMRYSMW